MNELTVFKQFEANLVSLEESDAGMEFPDTTDGIDERRKWYRKLRKGTNALDKIRKEAKADYLRLGREVDSEAKTIQVRLDVMELPHKTVLDEIEAAIQKEIDDLAEANRLKAEAEEQKRLDDLAEREAKAQAIIDAAAEVERKAKEEAERVEREKKIEADKLVAVEAAKKQAEQDAIEAANQAELDKARAVKEAECRAEQAAEAKEKAEAEQRANDLEVANREAEIERKRVADEDHRKSIEQEAIDSLMPFVPTPLAKPIIEAISAGKIANITIKY